MRCRRMSVVSISKTPAEMPSPFPPDVSYVWGEEGMALPTLPPAEQALLGGSASEKRVRDFCMGRTCARAALERLEKDGGAIGTELEEDSNLPPIGRVRGRAPQWPVGIVGAITHTGGFAAAAVARSTQYFGIGLDLERLRRGVPRLARRILRPEEQALLGEQPQAAQDGYITTIFSAKESIFKALNPATGIYLGFQDAAVELEPPGNSGGGEFSWTLRKYYTSALKTGFVGHGRYTRQDNMVLTAVWVTRLNPE